MGQRALSSKRARSSVGPSSQQSTLAFNQERFLGTEQEVWPMSHASSIPIDIACLLYYIFYERQVDVARVISNEIRMIASSGHRLGTRTPTTLDFPGLIMGLYMHVGVVIISVVHGTIEGVVNDRYILRHCMPRE
ncbi:hypothetical protein KIW84_021813 [Lathyrus oleraceus]|uniref:Uncharacterized protein n=1 Tax=Pisum sativum TaxID=3888 RepID=A0A9D5B4H0_PEA|nr:hypothetical protein KIW84_021813 [Pisum sativum]